MKARWIITFLVVIILVAGVVGTAQAVVVQRGGTIPAGQTIDDDVILGGTDVQVDGTVNGTLLAAGDTVTINGTVKGDAILGARHILIGQDASIQGNLFAGSGTIDVKGAVGGSIFAASGALSLESSSRVGYNLYYAGYDLQTAPASIVEKDISAGTYQSVLAGGCRNLNLASTAVIIKGTINGDARIRVAEPGQYPAQWPSSFTGFLANLPPALPSGLTVDPGAKIAGKLTYISPVDQSSSIQAVPGQGIVYQTPQPQERIEPGKPQQLPPSNFFAITAGFWLWALLRDMATMILLGGLATGLINTVFRRVVSAARQKPIQSGGIGLLALVLAFFVFPITAIALVLLALFFGLLTLADVVFIILGLGFSILSLAVVAFVILLSWTGKLIVAYVIGEWILRRLNSPVANGRFWPLALGAVILAIVLAIPFLGWLVWFVLALVGLGAIWYAYRTPPSGLPQN